MRMSRKKRKAGSSESIMLKQSAQARSPFEIKGIAR
jgi:hypothetical protein